MKPQLYIVVSVLLLFSTCKKDQSLAVSDNVKGEWEWVKSSGSITGGIYTPETEGYHLSLKLDSSHYTRYKNGMVTKSGTYTIVNKTSMILNKNEDFIIYDGDTIDEQIINITPTTLYLADDFPDGYTSEYSRSH